MRERLLTKHFVQRFIDNDVISPQADRRQALSVAAGALVASSVVCTLFLGFNYLFVSFHTPGQTAMEALGGRFFFLGLSALALALIAVALWNTIVLDERDATILGPLPLPYAVVLRAKLKAVAIVAVVFSVALNAISSVAYPIVIANTLPVGISGVATMVAAQFMSATLAGVFGFVSVIAFREVLRLVAGRRWFARVSAGVQASLVVLLGTLLLLLPGSASNVPRWLADSAGLARWHPALWFLGLHERLAGHVFASLPRADYPDRIATVEAAATARYASFHPSFLELSKTALIAVALGLAIAVMAYGWNSRVLPLGAPARRGRHSVSAALIQRIAATTLVRTPSARAGFFFALKALWRSAPQRLSLATAIGIGLAATMVLLRTVPFDRVGDVASAPLGIFGAQVVLLAVAVLGFRQAVRVPAELRANWTFRLCWSGDERAYLSGIKLAGLITLVLPVLAGMGVISGLTLGWPTALAHGAVGLIFALLLFDLSLFQFGRWPFAASYASEDNVTALASIYALGFIAGAYVTSWIEREALASAAGTAWLIGTALAAVVIVQRIDARPHPARNAENWNQTLPDGAHVDLSGVDW